MLLLLLLLPVGISVSGTYMGCFRDTGCSSSTRLRATLAANAEKMTVKTCVSMANIAGWPLAGLAPGTFPGTTSCFGGDKLPAATAAVVGGCLAACSGNTTERCGDSTNCQVSIYTGEQSRLQRSQHCAAGVAVHCRRPEYLQLAVHLLADRMCHRMFARCYISKP
jgi:hypothetical protein